MKILPLHGIVPWLTALITAAPVCAQTASTSAAQSFPTKPIRLILPYPPGGGVVVCSPWHAGMNLSFAVLGLTMATGAICAVGAFAHRRVAAVAAGLFVLLGALALLAPA